MRGVSLTIKMNEALPTGNRQSDTRYRTPSGNTASSAVGSFAYDGYNRLASSQTAAETTTYTYNALGQRIKKINQNGLATSFHYGPDGELLYEQDQAGNTKAYVWLNGRPLARIDNDAQIYYYHVDHLGTPWAMTNSAGAVVWKANYEPFGRATVRINTVENNLRSLGQYFDRETGMHYNYFRDYDPTTGRYIQFDPIGLAGGLNGFIYANQNPLSYTDPLGLKTYRCTKPLNALTDKFGSGVSKWASDHVPAAYHQYSCVVDGKGKTTCGGQDHTGFPILPGPGKPSDDSMGAGQCKQTEPDNKCFEQCLMAEWGKPRPTYGIPFGQDCQEYDEDVNQRCRNQCKK